MTAIEEVRQKMLTGPISDYSDFGFGRMVCIDKYSGRLIGFSGLKFLPELHDVDIGYRISDIGYRFLPEFWGQGYATESEKVFMRHVVPALNLTKLIGLAFSEN